MKVFCTSVVLCVFTAIFAASPFTVGEFGEVAVDGVKFKIVYADSNWRSVSPSASNMKSVEGKQIFAPSKGAKAELTVKTEQLNSNQLNYKALFKAVEPLTAARLSLTAVLPLAGFNGKQLLFDGKSHAFPERYDASLWRAGSEGAFVSEVVIPLKNGTLTVNGRFKIDFQDSRRFKGNEFILRLCFTNFEGRIKDSAFDARFTFRPYRSTKLNLSKIANMGYADPFSNDKKGGWTDQGPENDLRTFKSGDFSVSGIDFHALTPAENNGRTAVMFANKERPYFLKNATLELPEGSRGTYLYLIHALAWIPKKGEIGAIRVMFADGTEKTLKVDMDDVGNFWYPGELKRAGVIWVGESSNALIGLYMTRFEIGDKKIKSLTFSTTEKAVWGIVAATLSDNMAAPPRDWKYVIEQGPEWQILKNKKPVVKNSVLDFSFLLDAPAGKYGFIRSVNGNFEFAKRPGVPVRFYGANVCDSANIPTFEQARLTADAFAAAGYNILRLHHFDNLIPDRSKGRSVELDPKKMERMDYLVAEMKKRGVYITLDAYISRTLEKGELPEFPDRKISPKEFKDLIFISESAMKNWEEFSTNLFNHVNKFTGLAWKDDPAFITVSLVNEDTIFSRGFERPLVKKLYEDAFMAWCAKHDIKLTESNRARCFNIFLIQLYDRAYDRMAAHLKKLGVKALLTDQNFWEIVPMAFMRDRYEVVDTHYYWIHPGFLEKDWEMPMLIPNKSAIASYGGIFTRIATNRIFGKPLTLTEWDYLNPNNYNVEGAFLNSAYASLQGWNALCRFTFSHYARMAEQTEQATLVFSIANDPMRMLSERAGGVFFTRGDVKTSDVSFPFVLNKDYMETYAVTQREFPYEFRRLSLIGKVGIVVEKDGRKLSLPENSKAVLTFSERLEKQFKSVPAFLMSDKSSLLAALLEKGIVPKKNLDLANERFLSSTGELCMDSKARTLSISTPRSEGFILNPGQMLSGAFAKVDNKVSFAAFMVAAIDDKPLASSRRILLLHLTESKNTGAEFFSKTQMRVRTLGKLPILMRRGKADVTLKGTFEGFRLYAVAVDGKRLKEVPFKRASGSVSFEIRTDFCDEAVLAYEFVKE